MDAAFHSLWPLPQPTLSGVVGRFPRLRFVMTEFGCAWVRPPGAAHGQCGRAHQRKGRTGELARQFGELSETSNQALQKGRTKGG